MNCEFCPNQATHTLLEMPLCCSHFDLAIAKSADVVMDASDKRKPVDPDLQKLASVWQVKRTDESLHTSANSDAGAENAGDPT